MVRVLILWIIIASLPLRGIAAEIAAPCVMTHAGAASVRADTDTACHKASPPAHSTCRACCASHVGVSAPPALAVFGLAPAHGRQDFVSPVSSFAGWIPSPIERPPRA